MVPLKSSCCVFKVVIERQGGSLDRLGQEAQEIRRRIDNFPGNLPILDDEIAGLSGEASRVAVLYDQPSGLVTAEASSSGSSAF